MRIIFMGTPDFGLPTLEYLYNSEHDLIAIVTQPDKKKGRGKKIVFSPVKDFAIKNDVLVLQPKKASETDFLAKIKELKPDLIITAAYGQILKQELLDIPKCGCINIHGSILPKYRGASPIQSCLLNGDTKTGITIINMAKRMDAGNIIAIKEIDIEEDDNCETLFNKLSILARDVIADLLKEHKGEPIIGEAQDETKVTFCKKIEKSETEIDWNYNSDKIVNMIRAFSPFPGAKTMLNNKGLKILSAKKSEIQIEQNGKVKVIDNKIFVGCDNGSIEVLTLKLEGKRLVSAKDFLLGRNIDNYILGKQ